MRSEHYQTSLRLFADWASFQLLKKFFCCLFSFLCILILKQWTYQLALSYGSQLLRVTIYCDLELWQQRLTVRKCRIKLWIHAQQFYVSYRPKLMAYSYCFEAYLLLWHFVQFSGHGLPDLLPPNFCLPCCCLPVLYIEKILDVLPISILLSTSRLSKGLSSSVPSVKTSSILSKWPAHFSLSWLRMLKASHDISSLSFSYISEQHAITTRSYSPLFCS